MCARVSAKLMKARTHLTRYDRGRHPFGNNLRRNSVKYFPRGRKKKIHCNAFTRKLLSVCVPELTKKILTNRQLDPDPVRKKMEYIQNKDFQGFCGEGDRHRLHNPERSDRSHRPILIMCSWADARSISASCVLLPRDRTEENTEKTIQETRKPKDQKNNR